MKRVMLWSLLGLLVTMCACMTFTSCDDFKSPWSQKDYTEELDSVYVADCIESLLNPSFGSTYEIKEFRDRLIEEYAIDETFRTMPEDVLNNVVTVCFKRTIYVTKKDIVHEYRANKEIYDNLAPETPQAQVKEEEKASDEQVQSPPGPKSISYRYELDTVDGKPSKTLVKEERYESK